MPCALFYQEKQAKSEIYLIAASWVDGYLSSTNQHAPNTYDTLSFETSELLMSVLEKHCKNNPKDSVFGVINNLFKKIQKDKLLFKSKKVEIIVGDRKTILYEEVIKRMQLILSKNGYYTGDMNGAYKPSLQEAIKKYQLSINFKQTGFPDQSTLWHLFRSN